MLKPLLVAVCLSLVSVPSYADDAKFDPGVAAPKVAKDYYKGAEQVVVHISMDGDDKTYITALANVNNYIKALDTAEQKTDAVIVMNGDGLKLLTSAKAEEMENDAKLPKMITDLKEKGVKFLVCYNMLLARKIKFADLYDAKPEDIVPSGVAEVGRLQAQNYRLLKP